MAPGLFKKTTNCLDNIDMESSHVVAIKSPVRTPTQSLQKKPMGISEGQKQSLIDNLQLEITERARKLRAQYALQAQSLRTRIDLRTNRIPTSIRKASMGELLERHSGLSMPNRMGPLEIMKPSESVNGPPALPNRIVISEDSELVSIPFSRGTKRKSDAKDHVDKENSDEPAHLIPNPKRRLRTNAAQSRQVTNPSTVLSPKSANSRTLPQSPIRPGLGLPQKSYTSMPASPLKPNSSLKATSPSKAAVAVATATLASMLSEKSKAERPKVASSTNATNSTVAVDAQRARPRRKVEIAKKVQDSRKVSNSSNTSNGSTGTTIVKNARKSPAAIKKDDKRVRTTGKKVVAAVEGSATGRRVLRKR